MEYQVIDNFLDEKYFNELQSLLLSNQFPWYAEKGVVRPEDEGENLFFMVHALYAGNVPQSEFYNKLIPLLHKLGVSCLLRIKANFFPNTPKIFEHAMHTDYEAERGYTTFDKDGNVIESKMVKRDSSDKQQASSGALLYINTCDGYTKLEDGTKIESVANRVLLHNPMNEHCSTTTSNAHARINININYINP